MVIGTSKWWAHHYSVKNHFVLFRSNYDSQPRADVAGGIELST